MRKIHLKSFTLQNCVTEITRVSDQVYLLSNRVFDKTRMGAFFFFDCPVLVNGSGFPDSSVGKESACNAGGPSSIPESGRSAGEGVGYLLQYSLGFPCGSAGKQSACNVGDLGLVPGLGRSPGEGKGYPL